MKKIMKSITTIAVVIAAIGLVAFVVTSNKKKSEAQTALVTVTNADVAVRIDTVKKESPALDFVANGNFVPIQEMNFSSENAGRVVNVLVKEGSYVHKGQVLATIKTDQLSIDLENAKANLQNAITDKARYENAYKTGGVTTQQVDQAKLALENAEAKVRQASIKIGDANIRSSINGVINKRYIEPGAVLAPGTQLFEIVDVSKLKLNVTVNENQVVYLKPGGAVKTTASVFPGKTFPGKITFIAPKADATLNFPVEIEITNNAANELKAGMYGSAIFDLPEQQAFTVISRNAFVGSVSSNQVFVMDKSNTAHLRKITAGRIIGDKVEVLDGLQENEIVITSGQINLTEGSKVAPIK